MPITFDTSTIKVNLVSNIAWKSFTRFLLKENAGVFFICIIGIMVMAVFTPLYFGSRREGEQEATKTLMSWISAYRFEVLMIGVMIGLILVWVLTLMRDKFYVVGIIVENNSFKVISRRNKLNTVKEYTGHLEELILYKDKMKFSPIDSAKLCYRVYRQSEYMGILVPDHFVWADYPTPRINAALKKLKHIISR